MPVMNGALRGALICLEGCDKAGKSTHAKLLIESLGKMGKKAHLINFPDRTTETGKMIDAYLKCEKEMKDEVIHLLFSANRWELVPKIKQLLLQGDSVILDRYAYSGVAFSAAKGKTSLEWCMGPDVGLPRPDTVIFLNCDETEAESRGDYGKERYERKEFQKKVKDVFFKLREEYWKVVDTSRDKEIVHQDILREVVDSISQNADKNICSLWFPSDKATVKDSME